MFSPLKTPLPGKKSVTRNKIKEVYYTTPVDNLESILNIGVQSHNRVCQLKIFNPELDISNPEVQSLRRKKSIRAPDNQSTRPLHDYVNLYPQPFNAMMVAVRLEKPYLNLCVLRISSDILDIPGTLITNMNAACADAKAFKPSDWTLPPAEFEAIRSLSFNNSDTKANESTQKTFKRTRQFEVLVLNFIPSRYINGIFVPNERLKRSIIAITAGTIPVEVNESLFLCDASTRQLRLFKPLPKRLREPAAPTNAFTLMMAPGKKSRNSNAA